MTAAITIGSYALADFVELNICQCKKVWPDSPILVSDDKSFRSDQIAQIAVNRGATYIRDDCRRGHFAGDIMAVLNALSFAKAHDADLAIKVSQRFIFKNPAGRKLLLDVFEGNHHMVFALPGRMKVNSLRPGATGGFCLMPVLTDLLVFRVKDVDAEELANAYRKKCVEQSNIPHGTFVEGFCNDLAWSTFKDRTAFLEDFTNHINGRPEGDIYLRRVQNHNRDFIALAREHGIKGNFDLREWSQVEGRGYFPRPRAV